MLVLVSGYVRTYGCVYMYENVCVYTCATKAPSFLQRFNTKVSEIVTFFPEKICICTYM